MKYISHGEGCDGSAVGGNGGGGGGVNTVAPPRGVLPHRNYSGNNNNSNSNNNYRRYRSNNGNNRSRHSGNNNSNSRQSKSQQQQQQQQQPQHRQGALPTTTPVTQHLPAEAMQKFYPLQWWEASCPAPLGALVFAAAAVATNGAGGGASNGSAAPKQPDDVNGGGGGGVDGSRPWLEHPTTTRPRPASGDSKSLLWAKTQAGQVGGSHGGDSHGSSSSSSSSASSQSIDSLTSFSPPLSSSSSVSSSPSPPALYDPHQHAHVHHHHHLVGVNGHHHHHQIDGQDMINEPSDLSFFVDVDNDDDVDEEVVVEFGDMLVPTATTTPATKVPTTATVTSIHRPHQQLSDEVDEEEDEEEELVLLQNLPVRTPAGAVGGGGGNANSGAPHSSPPTTTTTTTSARAIKTIALYHRNEDIDNVSDAATTTTTTATATALANDHIDDNDFERTMLASSADADEEKEDDRETKKVMVVPARQHPTTNTTTTTEARSSAEQLATTVFHHQHQQQQHHHRQHPQQPKADSILSATRMATVQQQQHLLQANAPRTTTNNNGLSATTTASDVGGGGSSHSKEMQRKQWLDGHLSDLILKAYTHRRQERNLLTHKCHMQEVITACLAAHFGPGMYFKIFLIGSSLTNIGSRRSDIDLCMVIYDERGRVDERYNNRLVAEAMLTRISNILEHTGLAFGSKVIRANVPIVKFYDGHGVEVNLNLNKLVTIQNSLLLVYYCSLDARVAPFLFIVKLWAQKNGINCAYFKSLSSYSLSLMAIFYLSAICEPSVLPSFNEVVASFGQLLNQKLFNFYQPLAAGLEMIAKHLHVTSSHPLLASPPAPLGGGGGGNASPQQQQQQLVRTPHYYVPMFRISKLSKDGGDLGAMMLLNNNNNNNNSHHHGGAEARAFGVDQIISKVTFLTAEQANQRQQQLSRQAANMLDNKEGGGGGGKFVSTDLLLQPVRDLRPGMSRVQQQQQQQQHGKGGDGGKKGLLNGHHHQQHQQQQQQPQPFYLVNASHKNVSDKLYCDRNTKTEPFGSSLSNGQLEHQQHQPPPPPPPKEQSKQFKSKCTKSLGQLFAEFIEYYAESSVYDSVISVRTGHLMKRTDPTFAIHAHTSMETFICVEEPFNHTNTSHSVHNDFMFGFICRSFRWTQDNLRKMKMTLNDFV